MNNLQAYLTERYKATKWPYYSLNHTRFDVGSSFDQDVIELREKEMIQPTPGINGWLIEIINLIKWEL